MTPNDISAISADANTGARWVLPDSTWNCGLVAAIRERFPKLLDPPSDDICYATQNRQLAIKAISGEADLVIVVGSANSSNSVRLAEVALEAGAKTAHRVDDHELFFYA